MNRLLRLFGWPDRATATMAVALYLFMSVSFAALGVIVARSQAEAFGPVRLSLFVAFLLAHIALHWFSLRLLAPGGPKTRQKRIAYCLTQSAIVVVISVLTLEQRLSVGMWATLMAETAALLWPEWRVIVLSACFYLGVMALNMILVWGSQEFVDSLPLSAVLFGGILLYALLLAREGRTRYAAQTLVQELEAAQRQLTEYAEKVEELTIGQERQRMAREMHDTLAQGLAGVILQLEAADGHLEKGRPAEARGVVQQAIQRSRQTLHEARRAIQALRSSALDQKDLVAALASEVSEFEASSGVPATFVVEGKPGPVSPDAAQQVLRIVQEGLSNVGRHARARHVQVKLVQNGHNLQLLVQDDGRGFDADAAMQRPDCFGLQGMHERAQRIGAALRVESAPLGGTTLVLSLECAPEPERGPGQGPIAGAGAGEESSP